MMRYGEALQCSESITRQTCQTSFAQALSCYQVSELTLSMMRYGEALQCSESITRQTCPSFLK